MHLFNRVTLSSVLVMWMTLSLAGCGSSLQSSLGEATSRMDMASNAVMKDVTTWTHCADESGHCSFTGSALIRYGGNGVYVTRTLTDGTDCSNSVFGDPIVGVYKACDIAQVIATPSETWTRCAGENETCSFTGTAVVRYGANGTFATGTYTSAVGCNNAVFGDPIVGVVKSCDYQVLSSPTVPPTPSTPTPPPMATPNPTAPASLTTGSVVTIQSASNQFCLTNLNGSLSNGAQQVFASCNSLTQQNYLVTQNSDGSVVLKNQLSGLCLDIPYATSQTGTALQQYECNGTAAQSFKPVTNGNNYVLKSKSNSLCLDSSRSDGVLQQMTCNGSTAQTFSVGTAGSTVAPSPTPPAPATPTPSSGSVAPKIGTGYNKGMAVGLYYLNAQELAVAVQDMKSMGVSWVRMEFPWNLIQPNNANSYNLEAWDRAVQACNAAGIQMLGMIDYTPQWARAAGTNQFYPPTNIADFGTYSAFIAKRYSAMGVHTWEIWNEENGATFFQPAPNAALYVSLLKSAYTSIKSVDSSALVMVGGMATFGDDGINQNARTFLAGIYAAGGKPYFDAIAFHPYTYPELPTTSIYNNWGQMYASSPSLRSIMTDNGDASKKIWMTELGYPTFPNGQPSLTEAGQAAYLQQAYQLQASFDWAGPLFWYTYHDSTNPDPGNPEDYFGLLRFDGSQKPAYLIYKNLPK